MTRAEDAMAACELGAWAVGMMFVESSPRRLDLDDAKRLRSAISPGTLAVGGFADAAADAIRRAVEVCRLDAVQLHGSETPDQCRDLGVPAYKAVSLAEPGDLARIAPFAGRAAGLFVETVRRLPGGRERIRESEQKRRWLLAREANRYGTALLCGELTPENVFEAIRTACPKGVDVSGGVESAPGIKDRSKLEAFFKAVRSVEG
ncbi:MAG: phosphoribosylanthranilate isomerase [Elusimicrobia bacterium]|nr:phosphoribosylanthranilate isomerase [Elusimicrobiota bacterium]